MFPDARTSGTFGSDDARHLNALAAKECVNLLNALSHKGLPNDLYYEKLEALLYQMAEIYDQVGDPSEETD